jgi:hypothetical protein
VLLLKALSIFILTGLYEKELKRGEVTLNFVSFMSLPRVNFNVCGRASQRKSGISHRQCSADPAPKKNC